MSTDQGKTDCRQRQQQLGPLQLLPPPPLQLETPSNIDSPRRPPLRGDSGGGGSGVATAEDSPWESEWGKCLNEEIRSGGGDGDSATRNRA